MAKEDVGTARKAVADAYAAAVDAVEAVGRDIAQGELSLQRLKENRARLELIRDQLHRELLK